MTDDIYRIKIRQLQLHKSGNYDYFPFDNMYLVPKERTRELAPKLFKYCLIMDITEPIKKALRAVKFEKKRHLTLKRNDEECEWKTINRKDPVQLDFLLDFLDQREWSGIVPTYAIRAPKQGEITGQKQLQYVVSYAIKSMHNNFAAVPTITLQTPKRTIPALCAMCKHVASFYQNKCNPATLKCRNNIYIHDLEPDVSGSEGVENSIKEAGAIE